MNVGDRVAERYELIELIGRGGMGRVFRGFDHVLQRPVAVKALARALVGDQAAINRVVSEARLAARVQHPNVVTVYDALLDAHDGEPAIVLELVDGPTLSVLVQPGGIEDIEAGLDLIAGAAAGLQAAHDVDLIHRDVSTRNILLDGGTPRLTDFGIARSVVATETMTQTVRGSVTYIAPEQATGTSVGPLADVYALACVATSLLTGAPPFDAEEPLGIVDQHLRAAPPDIRERRPEIPAQVADAIHAALSKDPAERPPSAAAFAAALGRPITSAPSLAVPVERAARAVAEVTPPDGIGTAPPVRGVGHDTQQPTGDAQSSPFQAPTSQDVPTEAWPGPHDQPRTSTGAIDEPTTSVEPLVASSGFWTPIRTLVVFSACLLAVVALAVGAQLDTPTPDVASGLGPLAPPTPAATATAVPTAASSPTMDVLPEVAATDAVLDIRSKLLDAFTAELVAPDAYVELDERLADAINAIRDWKVAPAERDMRRFRESLREATADGLVSPEVEVLLLELGFDAELALTAMAAEAARLETG